jgi:hypothetical protein
MLIEWWQSLIEIEKKRKSILKESIEIFQKAWIQANPSENEINI